MSKPRIPEGTVRKPRKQIKLFLIVLVLGLVVASSVVIAYSDTSNQEGQESIQVLSDSVPDSEFVLATDPNQIKDSRIVDQLNDRLTGSDRRFSNQRDSFFDHITEELQNDSILDVDRKDFGKVVKFGNISEPEYTTQLTTVRPVRTQPYAGTLLSLDVSFDTAKRAFEKSQKISVQGTSQYRGYEIVDLAVDSVSQGPSYPRSNELSFVTLSESEDVHSVGYRPAVEDSVDAYLENSSGILKDQFGEETLLYLDADLQPPFIAGESQLELTNVFAVVNEDAPSSDAEIRLAVLGELSTSSFGDLTEDQLRRAGLSDATVRLEQNEIVIDFPLTDENLETIADQPNRTDGSR